MEKQNNTSTRRHFLKTSSAIAAGAAVLGQVDFASGAFAGGDDTIRIGLIGCGGRGSGATAQALSTEGNVKLVAMGDAYADRIPGSMASIKNGLAPELHSRIDVAPDKMFSGFDAYKDVINSGVDLVILATPPGFRPIHFKAAVEADKHVFMEKPVATDSPGVRQVLEYAKVAKQKNLKVGVGLQRHHQAPYLETMKRIHDGQIGDIISLRCYWNGGGVWEPRATRDDVSSEMEYQMRNWYYYNWLCGDHITEQHIHNLDVCNWVMDAYPVVCHGMGGRQVRTDKRYGEIYDHHAIEYTYEDGTPMFSQCRHIRNCRNEVNEHAHGSKGVVNFGRAKIEGAGVDWSFRTKKKTDPYQVEHDDLFAAIRNDVSYSEAENGAYSSLTSIMGRMASYSGKPVTWDQALNSQVSLLPSAFTWDTDPQSMPNENGEYAIATPGVTKVV